MVGAFFNIGEFLTGITLDGLDTGRTFSRRKAFVEKQGMLTPVLPIWQCWQSWQYGPPRCWQVERPATARSRRQAIERRGADNRERRAARCACAVVNGEERREALAERVNGLGARCRSERDGRRAVIRETDRGGSGPEAGAEDGRDAGRDDHGDGRVHSGGDGARREADAAGSGLFVLDPGAGAALARRGNHRPVEADRVADQRPLCLDQAFGAAVANGEKTAELVHHFVGIQARRPWRSRERKRGRRFRSASGRSRCARARPRVRPRLW